MKDKLRAYIDYTFRDAPQIKRTIELKEEMLQNLIEKYDDLIAEGKTEEAAYNIATASIGDISDLIKELNKSATGAHTNSPETMARSNERSARLTAIAVALYILSPVPCIIFQDAIFGPVMLFVMVALATGLIIYNSMTKVKFNKMDDTVVEEFKEWKYSNTQEYRTFRAIKSAISSITVVVYLLVSFLTGAWHITWIIFLISSAIVSIVKAAFDMKR